MLNPLPASKWNYTTAAHLCNRAGFGDTPEQIKKLARMNPQEAVGSFVDYSEIPDTTPALAWAKPDPDRVERYQEIQRMAREEKNSTQTEDQKREVSEKRLKMVRELQRTQAMHIEQMRADWLKRMASGPRPLQEKLTLFWHGHFATSALKVQDAYFMWLQIDTFRQKGSGNWLDLLQAMATDPAMLIWLDQAQSRKEHPNENFARECMELFTLGEGHYTEKDVTEAARAMTGWSLDRPHEEYVYRPRLHDYGVKTVLGTTGNLSGRQVLELIVAQPQAARFITGKLWKFFASENPSPQLIDALAESFRAGGNNFGPFLRTIFSSEEFYADSVMHNQIKSPVQWLVNSVRLLEREMPPPIVATQMTKTLGQDLLAPPNVKGWDGGVSWITTNTLLARYNQAAILVMGQGNLGATGDRPGQKMAAARANEIARQMRPVDVNTIINEEERRDAQAVIAKLEKWFIQGQLTEKHREVLRDYLEPRSELNDQDVRHAIRLLMSTPEYQLT
ncbi:MAG TPA: DUF1800 domain-containing protein [Candidatus Saccharimonadales bacterium]|nr:DUF1800 domain-containing protein [Candidatus Saccharimonadales bacterium]